MNYLTNYYKNLSEQLQERVNQLQKLIEMQIPQYSDEEKDMAAEIRHDNLIDTFAKEHTAFFPHKKDAKTSIEHVKSVLHKMPGIFTSGEELVNAANGAGLVFNMHTDAPISGSLRGGEPTQEQQNDYLSELGKHIDAVSVGKKGAHHIYSRTGREGSEHLYKP